jgi:23S rRNA (guanosine2251-2'-O)-methyltransferase
MEALQNPALQPLRLHLANSNKQVGIMDAICQLAKDRKTDIQYHSKLELSRVSKNSRQDQGVALDIYMPEFMSDDFFLQNHPDRFQLLALDGVTNPQNLGMIIRSVCASSFDGILLPEKGCARLDALVIKASAGTLFRCPVIRCKNLDETLDKFSQFGVQLVALDSHGSTSLFDYHTNDSCIFILGNETKGLSQHIKQRADHCLFIPLRNDVESLNVAVAASLVVFHQT